MEQEIFLKRVELDDSNSLNTILNMINSDEELQRIFSGQENTMTRLLNASYVSFIQHSNKNIGFIMIVNNERTNTQEVDMGIMNGFRKNGYGTKALELLKEVVEKDKIMVEVQIQNTNMGAIRMVEKNGCKLIRQTDEYNYYAFDFTEENKTI